MMLLLDTHVLLWWLSDDSLLGKKARGTLSDFKTAVYISELSLFECAIKVRLGKLEADLAQLEKEAHNSGFIQIGFDALCAKHLSRQANMPHSDPFDAGLAAQAIAKHMTLVTADKQILACQIDGLSLIDARK